MAICLDWEACVGCGCCSDVCRQGALGLEAKAVVYAARCIECGECLAMCPAGALALHTNEQSD